MQIEIISFATCVCKKQDTESHLSEKTELVQLSNLYDALQTIIAGT